MIPQMVQLNLHESQTSCMNRAPKIAAIVLAAGASQRMGEPKQLLPLGSRRLLEVSLSAVTLPEVTESIVVLGAHSESIKAALWLDEATVLHNPDWESGMLSSIQVGLQHLCSESEPNWPDFVIVHPSDFALVRHTTIQAMLLRALTSDHRPPVVSPAFMGRTGHPILLGRSLFSAVLGLSRELGLDAVVHAHRDERIVVEVDDPGIHFDIDTPEDYQAAVTAFDAIQRAREDILKRLIG